MQGGKIDSSCTLLVVCGKARGGKDQLDRRPPSGKENTCAVLDFD